MKLGSQEWDPIALGMAGSRHATVLLEAGPLPIPLWSQPLWLGQLLSGCLTDLAFVQATEYTPKGDHGCR